MVGLVIEEMRKGPGQRILLRLAGHIAISKCVLKGLVAEASDEAEDAAVFGLAGRTEIGELIVKDLIEPLDPARHPLEPAHPHTISDQDVVEGGVNRAEEGRPPRAVVGRA